MEERRDEEVRVGPGEVEEVVGEGERELRKRVGDMDGWSAWGGDEIGEAEKANGAALLRLERES